MQRISLLLLTLAVIAESTLSESASSDKLALFTVATESNDGFLRFLRSADRHGYNVTVLGRGREWKGGDVMRYPGGGQKVNLLRDAIQKIKNDEDWLVMFVDSYDVVLTAGPEDIVKAFQKLKADVVFSTEGFCWPDPNLAVLYPEVKPNEKRFLNSGGFIGYAPKIAALVSEQLNDNDDDQLYYTRIFLDPERRQKLNIKLDTKSAIFQNLNGAMDEVTVKFKGNNSYLYNFKTGFQAAVVHGNGPIKTIFNSLSNYLDGQWTPKHGCLACLENTFTLDSLSEDSFPQVFMAIFIEFPTAFIEDFFQNIAALDYPKKRMDLLIHYAVEYHRNDVDKFVAMHGKYYRSFKVIGPEKKLNDKLARNLAVEESEKKGSAYFFSVDGEIQLENAATLQRLVEQNRSVVAPLVVRPSKTWSNFWGDINKDGFYMRSADYMDIVKGIRVGLWNVPYVSGVYLVQGRHIPMLHRHAAYMDSVLDSDMAICKLLREQIIFMYVDNRVYYGHLTDSSNFETSHLHNDLYAIMDNVYTWQKKYVHADYETTLHHTPFEQIEQPCPDVFWFPMSTSTFCQHLVEEVENLGEWSAGKNDDPRLAGGYENVPTVDIHMRQISFEPQWLYFLREFIVPYNAKVFKGYHSEAKAIMNFLVRYRPNEQDRLRPHDDASTYTINIALNEPGVDYEGGGTRFLRYNCSVIQSRKGWMLMHPGRLTHHHEGLITTNGTRYIMVAFIDP